MAISLGLLAGIIAGAVSLTSLAVIIVVLGLRYKHKRLLSQINLAGERHLSGFRTSPSAIMSITDEDVARMPGTRASVRRSLHAPCNRNSLYTPMASRESLPRRAYVPKAQSNDRDDHEPVVPQQSWPLPRRMTRADGTPLVKLPLSTLTPVTERSKTALAPPTPKDTGTSAGTLNDKIGSSGNLDLNGKGGKMHEATLSTDLAPRPLFHGQQRSSSYGMIAGLTDGSKSEPRASRRTSQFPRSKSMYNQEPGVAPQQPLPPLPFEIPSKTIPRASSPEQSTRRASGGSLFSEKTSILDDNWSKAFSQAGTNFTSITLSSPPVPASTFKKLEQHQGTHVVWDSSFEEGRVTPIRAAKQMLFRPQLDTQRSFRASIQESLPRSKSSGLSLSMSLHGPSRAESRASLAIDLSSTHSKSRVASPRSTEKRRIKRGVSPSSPLCRTTDFTIHDDTKSKRASTSTLHEISGNEGSPMPSPWDKRPRSIATSRPLEWDIESLSPIRISASKDKVGERERQDCIRISKAPTTVPSPAEPPVIKEQEGLPQENLPPHNQSREGRLKHIRFRPPSRQDFDFALQTSPSLCRVDSLTTNNASPFSPTQFMMNLYREEDHSPDCEVYTPTRKPSTRRPSSTHLNRRKTIFDDPTPTVWPLATIRPPPETHHPDPEKPTDPTAASQPPTPSSRPTSFLINFPWPQPPTITTRNPKTPIRGPRPPPFRYISPNKTNSNRRRSPIRVGKHHYQRSGTSPVKDLHRSVAALRRMNSEVVGSGSGSGSKKGRKSREHRRYLSIGEEGSGIFEEDEEEESSHRGSGMLFFSGTPKGDESGIRDRAADGKENLPGSGSGSGSRDTRIFRGMATLGGPQLAGNHDHNGNGNGGNDTTTRAVGKKSPNGVMYDRDGFLKELDAWLR